MDETTIRIVRGAPDDDEIAALVAVLAAINAAPREYPLEQSPTLPWQKARSPYAPRHHRSHTTAAPSPSTETPITWTSYFL
ncbi:acyl-CoA carboxylase epsilon subunit [Amycolatopsis sp. lyj-90]|uniref:acyl-CoA carboxylase epsilon subunit n=1 Tax=Amycolatopsis sp. lyj-90 TaxID=2789285 RepID=UPI00397CE713